MHDWIIFKQVGIGVIWKCNKCGSVYSSSRRPSPTQEVSVEKDGRYQTRACFDDLKN